ncbi:MAG: helix-turn-helix domain-containing protein [Microbacterium sp.]|nr:helix-turn-helix domain-containing protein [Microbacterium sp.]MDO8383870.1 helix-turn-helix domain-containing protein [Microbacterium sp.]
MLTDDEREQLARWARRRKSSQALALRSRIALECATGAPNTVVAERLGISRPTVGKWRARFLEARLDGLVDDPRPGRPATVTAEQPVRGDERAGRHRDRVHAPSAPGGGVQVVPTEDRSAGARPSHRARGTSPLGQYSPVVDRNQLREISRLRSRSAPAVERSEHTAEQGRFTLENW